MEKTVLLHFVLKLGPLFSVSCFFWTLNGSNMIFGTDYVSWCQSKPHINATQLSNVQRVNFPASSPSSKQANLRFCQYHVDLMLDLLLQDVYPFLQNHSSFIARRVTSRLPKNNIVFFIFFIYVTPSFKPNGFFFFSLDSRFKSEKYSTLNCLAWIGWWVPDSHDEKRYWIIARCRLTFFVFCFDL